jgi:hypothetical protein
MTDRENRPRKLTAITGRDEGEQSDKAKAAKGNLGNRLHLREATTKRRPRRDEKDAFWPDKSPFAQSV